MCLPTIQEVQTATFWETVCTNAVFGLGNIERVRIELRELMQYIINGDRDTFEINLVDTIFDGGEIQPIITRATYKQRVFEYLEQNTDNPVLQKIYRVEQLSNADIHELERIFWQELGTKEEYVKTYEQQDRYRIWGGRIAAFLRSVKGIDRNLAREKYIALIQGEALTPEQEEYLNDILDYVCQNGDITRETMAEEPFSSFSWQPVFNTRLTALVHYVNKIHEVIVAL
jgi:type I restriction enzyme R subunit